MNHYRVNFSQKDVDGRLFDGWTEVKAMSFDELVSLPGVGPGKARRIMEFAETKET